jgi:hypothetical protein
VLIVLPLIVLELSFVAGCASRRLPDPEEAARAYARAAQEGDADALYRMMTRGAQRTYGRDGVRQLVAETRPELAGRAKSLQAPLEVEAVAELTYGDGEVAVLDLEQGTFFVSSAAGLPSGATTPGQALAELRRALAGRSYPGLARVLSQGSRHRMEDQLSSLVRSLEHPESADVSVQGDRATVTLPEGHEVTLRRERGVWKVEDFR